MVVWNTLYNHAMDRDYHVGTSDISSRSDAKLESPIVPMREVGASVTEGRQFGSFVSPQGQFIQAIRKGAGSIELQTIQGGGAEIGGAEAYGKDAREELRQIAKANEINLTAVHTPTNVGNLSGFNPQQGFVDQQRKDSLEEVKRAIDFAADVAGGGAVVVHTGEYQRPISDQKWAKDPETGDYRFLGFDEEPGRAVHYLVDKRTGRVIGDVQKSKVVYEPDYKTIGDWRSEGNPVPQTRDDGSPIQDDDWVDIHGNYVNPYDPDALFKRVPKWDSEKQQFQVKKIPWEDFERRAQMYNEKHRESGKTMTAEEMFYRTQTNNRILRNKGLSRYYSRMYDDNVKVREKLQESLKFYEKLEQTVPEDERWKLLDEDPMIRSIAGKYVPSKYELPSVIIKKAIADIDKDLLHVHESSAAADAEAMELTDTIDHIEDIGTYAKKQSVKSYAETGIHAMQTTKSNPHVQRDIFVAPENIFPEMGYGSHPEELKELVTQAREEMVKLLTTPTIKDPHEKRDVDGNLAQVPNRYFDPSMTKEKAAQFAERHIQATFDTQHLGMWRKHFMPEKNESKEQTDERFTKWYMEQVEDLKKSGIIGHIHMVDAIGSQHQHLPAGQGMMPVAKAIEKLRESGKKVTITSEGYAEDQTFPGRQLTESWKALGSSVYRAGVSGGAGASFADVHQSYFNKKQSPYFVFGEYSPSNDWTLWSEVPME